MKRVVVIYSDLWLFIRVQCALAGLDVVVSAAGDPERVAEVLADGAPGAFDLAMVCHMLRPTAEVAEMCRLLRYRAPVILLGGLEDEAGVSQARSFGASARLDPIAPYDRIREAVRRALFTPLLLTCDIVRGRLESYYRERLGLEETYGIWRHLRACAACRQALVHIVSDPSPSPAVPARAEQPGGRRPP